MLRLFEEKLKYNFTLEGLSYTVDLQFYCNSTVGLYYCESNLFQTYVTTGLPKSKSLRDSNQRWFGIEHPVGAGKVDRPVWRSGVTDVNANSRY